MSRPTQPCGVDCEKCTHFTGSNGWARVEWGCAKGHPSTSTVSLYRVDGCGDYREASRDELIFRRFRESASYHGDEGLKNRQAQARRLASGLATSLAEFGSMMDSDQVHAGREAVSALNRLADDIERAARMAKAFKIREDARRKAEADRLGDELASKLLVGWSEADIIECAKHLAAFDSSEGMKWRDARRGRSTLTESGLWSPNDRAQAYLRAKADDKQRAQRYAELRRDLAQALQTLERPIAADYATREDFDAWRQYLRDRAAAKASVVAVLATASVAARGERP